MKATTTLSAFIAAIELAQATVYLAGDSTMAKSGANDGVTDGSSTNFILPNPLSRLLANSSHQAGAATSPPTSSPTPPSSTKPSAAAPPAATPTKAASPRSRPY